MITNAWAWAERHNKLRKNEVHGEWEAKIILDDQFKFNEAEGFDLEQSTAMSVEVPWPTLCTHYMWTVNMHFPLLMATPKNSRN